MPISDLSDIKNAAREFVKMFEESVQRKTEDFRTEGTLFPPIFCRRYEPGTEKMRSCVYRVGTNRYDQFETALTEVLADGDHLIEKTTKISEKLESIGGRRETKFRLLSLYDPTTH